MAEVKVSVQEKELRELLDPVLLGEVKRLEIRTRRSLNADFIGQYRSTFRGQGLVYSDLREYQPGDEVKNIHWKATARTNKVYVKSYEEDRQLSILLVVDISSSTLFGAPKTKHLRAFEFAALVAMLAQKNQDALGLCLFSKEVAEFLPPCKSRTQLQKIILSLLQHRVLHPASNLSLALDYILKRQRRSALIFIISDFYCPPFAEPLATLALKHDVVCVLLEDPLDKELPKAGLVEFQDAESGERILIDTSNRKVLQAIKAEHDAHVNKLAELCALNKIDMIRLLDNPVQPLAELMRRRTARIAKPSIRRVSWKPAVGE